MNKFGPCDLSGDHIQTAEMVSLNCIKGNGYG
jgi:hypothetical protein